MKAGKVPPAFLTVWMEAGDLEQGFGGGLWRAWSAPLWLGHLLPCRPPGEWCLGGRALQGARSPVQEGSRSPAFWALQRVVQGQKRAHRSTSSPGTPTRRLPSRPCAGGWSCQTAVMSPESTGLWARAGNAGPERSGSRGTQTGVRQRARVAAGEATCAQHELQVEGVALCPLLSFGVGLGPSGCASSRGSLGRVTSGGGFKKKILDFS